MREDRERARRAERGEGAGGARRARLREEARGELPAAQPPLLALPRARRRRDPARRACAGERAAAERAPRQGGMGVEVVEVVCGGGLHP